MRIALSILILALGLSRAAAQEQENKLVTRLLRPNMELANSAQDKKFSADRVSVNKQATVTAFYVPQKSPEKTYAGTREARSKDFAATHRFQKSDAAANTASRSQLAKPAAMASKSATVRDAPEGSKKKETSKFAGTRPFLGKGKSQKAISQHDTPLTIDQVRELLNKNK